MNPVGSSFPSSASSSRLLSVWVSILTALMFPGDYSPFLFTFYMDHTSGKTKTRSKVPAYRTNWQPCRHMRAETRKKKKLYSITWSREVNTGHFTLSQLLLIVVEAIREGFASSTRRPMCIVNI